MQALLFLQQRRYQTFNRPNLINLPFIFVVRIVAVVGEEGEAFEFSVDSFSPNLLVGDDALLFLLVFVSHCGCLLMTTIAIIPVNYVYSVTTDLYEFHRPKME